LYGIASRKRASAALALTALGGPEPLPSGKEMKEVAPPPPECYDWSGFYVGAFGGYKFASVDTRLDATRDWNPFPLDQAIIHDHSADNLDTSGGEVGGLIGFNFQRGCWVFGIEGTGGYMQRFQFIRTSPVTSSQLQF
jgi:outer membrane immunogenic protein